MYYEEISLIGLKGVGWLIFTGGIPKKVQTGSYTRLKVFLYQVKTSKSFLIVVATYALFDGLSYFLLPSTQISYPVYKKHLYHKPQPNTKKSPNNPLRPGQYCKSLNPPEAA